MEFTYIILAIAGILGCIFAYNFGVASGKKEGKMEGDVKFKRYKSELQLEIENCVVGRKGLLKKKFVTTKDKKSLDFTIEVEEIESANGKSKINVLDVFIEPVSHQEDHKHTGYKFNKHWVDSKDIEWLTSNVALVRNQKIKKVLSKNN